MKKIILSLLLLSSLLPKQSEAKLLHAKGFGIGATIGQTIFWTLLVKYGFPHRDIDTLFLFNTIPTLFLGIISELIYRQTSDFNYHEVLHTIKNLKKNKAFKVLSSLKINQDKDIQELQKEIIAAFDQEYINERYNRIEAFNDLNEIYDALKEAKDHIEPIQHNSSYKEFCKKKNASIDALLQKISFIINIIKNTQLFIDQHIIKQNDEYIAAVRSLKR